MRKVIVQSEVSLDAVLENPHLWAAEFHNDETEQYFIDVLYASGGLLMGRVTYEGFAAVWPTRAGSGPMADRMNSLPKFVASRTLSEPLEWNATLLTGDVAAAVARLKQEPGKDLLQYGAGELTRTLMQHGLVDELRILVFPLAVGRGERIFENIEQTALKLLDTRTFGSGVVALHYQPQYPE